jgi:hypothetical protein
VPWLRLAAVKNHRKLLMLGYLLAHPEVAVHLPQLLLLVR